MNTISDEIISAEIKKNGNTNFITDSGFESGQQIFAIGDSHTIFFYNSMKIKEHWFYDNGYSKIKLPLTIYTLLDSELDILNIGNNLGNGHELYNIKEQDFVIMFFGFNDIQRNIHLHAANRYQDEINSILTKYISEVINYKNKYNIIPIIPCIYPNPRPTAVGQNSLGSYEERRIYTIYANNLLKQLCITNNLLYFDIYDFITDENGFIKSDFTNDDIHLDYNNKSLREIIDNKIIELCKSI